MKIRRESLAWAAGLFDGEGSISFCTRLTNKKSIRKGRQIQVAVVQSGEHAEKLLNKFKDAVVGLGAVNGPYEHRSDRKPKWQWNSMKFEHVQAVIAMLWPWLNEAKKSDAIRCLKAYHAYSVREYRA